ncbi:MAG TPA: SDR family oxidoreductase [Kofleriaceae bacterium]|nr:SDR family oxidoreductase [Kofleriaceae bacterium]
MSKHAIVIGAGSGVGRATTLALLARGTHVTAVARTAATLTGLGDAATRAADATDPATVRALLADAPDLVVVAAGIRPPMGPVDQLSWEEFSAAWNNDVRLAYEVGRAALARPLQPGSTVIVVSSGAGLGGSPLSGGYAGAKRQQMFMASYLQRESKARGLGIRFVAVVPRQLMAGTAIGEHAAATYAAESGITVEKYMERFPVPLDAAGAARAIVDIAAGEAGGDATLLGLTGKGLEVL